MVIKNNLKVKSTTGKGGDVAQLLQTLMGMVGGKGGGGSWQQNTFKIDKSGGELGEQIGTIKSFSERTNYGFIDCPEVSAAGYADVFLHGDMKKGYQQGQTIKFDCILNRDGKPVAINLRSGLKGSTQQPIVRNDWQPETFEIDNSGGELLQTLMGMVGGKGGGGSWQQNTFKIDKSGGELGEQIGTIKSFSERTNYGFIDCPEVKEAGYADVFLHGDMKKGYQQGQTVKFDCILNKDGKPVAINLKSGLK